MSEGKKRPVLDPKLLEQATREVSHISKDEGVHVALLGGYALQLYGSNRLTGDIDIVTLQLLASLPYGPPLSFGGVQSETPNGVPVDMIVRDDDYAPLYEAGLDKAVNIPGIAIPVVRPEYILAMKIAAARKRDAIDVDWLILSDIVDLKKARSIITKFLGVYAGHEFDRLVIEVRWRASQGLV